MGFDGVMEAKMRRIDCIKAMSIREMAKKIIEHSIIDEFCKSTCEYSETLEGVANEDECLKCCEKWLDEEDESFAKRVWSDGG